MGIHTPSLILFVIVIVVVSQALFIPGLFLSRLVLVPKSPEAREHPFFLSVVALAAFLVICFILRGVLRFLILADRLDSPVIGIILIVISMLVSGLVVRRMSGALARFCSSGNADKAGLFVAGFLPFIFLMAVCLSIGFSWVP